MRQHASQLSSCGTFICRLLLGGNFEAAWRKDGMVEDASDVTFSTMFGFTGRLFDGFTQTQYNTNRWYDPQLQQWLSVDPILFGAGDPNPRRYVGNDPVNKADPSGLEGARVQE